MKIKTRYTYTVVREDVVRNEKDLEDDIDFFKGALSDETGEFLYGGSGLKETVSVRMEISRDGGKIWEGVKHE